MGGAASTVTSSHPICADKISLIEKRNRELENKLHQLRASFKSNTVEGLLDLENAPPDSTADGHRTSAVSQREQNTLHESSSEELGTIQQTGYSSHLHRVSYSSNNPNDVSIHEAIGKRIDASEKGNAAVVELPRGGVYVKTALGAIQFGIPPETIKDSLNMGLAVPRYYVIPHERFNLNLGINVAEMEFPAYYNFFFLGTSVTLIASKEQSAELKLAFKETIEGPAEKHLHQDDEYGDFVDPKVYAARPDLKKEIEFFCEPRGGRLINSDTLIQWNVFDDGGVKIFGAEQQSVEIEIHDTPMGFLVQQDGEELAFIRHEHACFVPAPENITGWVAGSDAEGGAPEAPRGKVGSLSAVMGEGAPEALQAMNAAMEARRSSQDSTGSQANQKEYKDVDMLTGSHGVVVTHSIDEAELFQNLRKSAALDPSNALRVQMLLNTVPFDPPNFGVTMLGTSHGFDQSGTTTGFIVWLYGYGVVVDPPPHCDTYLMLNGVSPRLITAVILTHCHADHDAGTFQKVLKERRVTLMTTPTIYNHFIRKYSAVSGLKADFLKRLLDYQPVNIHAPFQYHGAVFTFFYALHALPCIGFKVELCGKTMVYSADTLNEPKALNELEKRGILSPERKQELLNFPWECDLILHECGVPPIHTPASTLQAQPEDVKQRLFAVHISDAAALQAGLRKALPGCSNTIVIPVHLLRSNIIDSLYLFSATDIFRDAGITECVEVLQMAQRMRYTFGTVLSGVIGGVFFIVSEGILQVEREGKHPLIMELGDYFGEISAMNGDTEKMKLTALTDVETIVLNRYSFNQYLSKCPAAFKRLKALEAMRCRGFANVLRLNSVFSQLTFQQRTQLQSLDVTNRLAKAGEILVDKDGRVDRIFIICKGSFTVSGSGMQTASENTSSGDYIQHKPSSASESHDGKIYRSNSFFNTSYKNLEGLTKQISEGAVFIPMNVFNEVVMGATLPQLSPLSPRAGLSLDCNEEGLVFEVPAKGFAKFLERNPGIQLALMKFTTGVVE